LLNGGGLLNHLQWKASVNGWITEAVAQPASVNSINGGGRYKTTASVNMINGGRQIKLPASINMINGGRHNRTPAFVNELK
jgi:hypothetical protein